MTGRCAALIGVWLAATAMAAPGVAAQDDPRAGDAVRRGQAAERAAEPEQAIAAYREAIAAAPGSRLARRAQTRLSWLEARGEGGYRPLSALLRMQALAPGALDRERLVAFEAELSGFPAGRVRREARAVAAAAWLDRMRDAGEAERAHRAWLAEPGLEPGERRLAESGMARARALGGDVSGGVRTLERAGLGETPEADALRMRSRRAVTEPIAFAVIAGFAVLAMALGGWRGLRIGALRRVLSPGRLALGAWTLVVPALIAVRYDEATEDTFVETGLLLGGVLVVALIAAVGLAESGASPRRRGIVAGAAALAVLAAGYVALGRAGSILGIVL